MLSAWSAWLDRAISAFNDLFPPNTFFNFDFQVRGTLAVLLVGLVCGADLIRLFILVLATGGLLAVMYNNFVLASFNPSLALSRKVRVRLCNFSFIVLLALIVNLSLHTVGALLINAMLVVPAATAANLCRNMRQLFWCTVGLCLFVGITGQWLSWSITLVDAAAGGGKSLNLGGGGIMVVLSVLLFFLSMIVGP